MRGNNYIKEKNTLLINEIPFGSAHDLRFKFFSEYLKDISFFKTKKYYDYDLKEPRIKAKISFSNPEKAKEAREKLNMRELNGKAFNIMWFETDKSVLLKKDCSIFIKGIEGLNPRAIYELFSKFGEIKSIKIRENEYGKRLNYGYISYYDPKNAENAIKCLDKRKINSNGPELKVEFFKAKEERPQTNKLEPKKNCKIFIRNLPDNISNEQLIILFSPYGDIKALTLDKSFATVTFGNFEEARSAIRSLDGKKLPGCSKKLTVVFYLSKNSQFLIKSKKNQVNKYGIKGKIFSKQMNKTASNWYSVPNLEKENQSSISINSNYKENKEGDENEIFEQSFSIDNNQYFQKKQKELLEAAPVPIVNINEVYEENQYKNKDLNNKSIDYFEKQKYNLHQYLIKLINEDSMVKNDKSLVEFIDDIISMINDLYDINEIYNIVNNSYDNICQRIEKVFQYLELKKSI